MPFIDLALKRDSNINTLLDANIRAEQVEVLLRNLLQLRHPEDDRFAIPFDDVIVTLNLAVFLISSE